MPTEFCQFLDAQDKSGTIRLKPLGVAKNRVPQPTLPGWKDVITGIVIDKRYAEGLEGKV